MKIRPFYDIVVVGSGPAGSMTALFAAKNGASVLILERDREVGIPVRCAEGISGRGLEKFFQPDERWIAQKINGAKLYAPNGQFCIMTAGAVGDGYVLERACLMHSFVNKLRKTEQIFLLKQMPMACYTIMINFQVLHLLIMEKKNR